ncbi:MAG TPA: AcvB/VirJ family lysyl-phosphatidylglycerol hydrolase, partial [Amaricoccus sp.]|nr:AcvB/VirJ family lysyl-phosphatidylglycerol hydrolase [Amaricoccus sp.]
FWSKRTPEETARDLADLIRGYTAKWGVADVLLAGYSFGADVLPDAFLALPPEVQARVRQVSLLGLSPQADWEITVAALLDEPSQPATPTPPSLARLPADRVQCIYGAAETDSPCPALAAAGAEIIETKGGHHFDGNYQALADAILAGLDRRRAPPPAGAPAPPGAGVAE